MGIPFSTPSTGEAPPASPGAQDIAHRQVAGARRRRTFFFILLVSLLLHAWAVWQLPIDADESLYLQAGFDYARLARSGDWQGIVDYPFNREHPPLVKLLYGGGVLALGEAATWENALLTSRAISAVFGVGSVALVAAYSPLAGLLLAVQTLALKYTSEAYLEALPQFFALLAVFALLRSHHPRDRWFWLSGIALGLAGAGKFSYFPILFVLAYIYLWEKRYSILDGLLLILAAGLTFLAFNPVIWPDPLGRLADAALFHAQYSQGAHVHAVGYPWYQPLRWVSASWGAAWHPQVFFYFGFDGLIALLAVLGLRREWRSRRWVAVWLALGMLLLLLWPTKWPQYTLVVLPALCLAAADTAILGWRRLKEEETYWQVLHELLPVPSRAWRILAALLVLLVLGGEVAGSIRSALLQRGWQRFTPHNSPLPSYTVTALLPGPAREMVIGTENGLARLNLSADTRLPENWQVWNTTNSALPANRVLALARAADGYLWVGTSFGLARLDPDGDLSFHALAIPGRQKVQISDLALDGRGRLWLAAGGGLVLYEQGRFTPIYAPDPAWPEQGLTTLAVAPPNAAHGEQLWIAGASGAARLDLDAINPALDAAETTAGAASGATEGGDEGAASEASSEASAAGAPVDPAGLPLTPPAGAWQTFPAQEIGLAGGASDLLVDAQGHVWLASLGGGLLRYDGQSWQAHRVSNSEIPSNTVLHIFESRPGEYWVATALPAEVGGVLSRFDGDRWQSFTPTNSGFSGGEPLALALDAEGRLWIGTRTAGIDIFDLPED